MKKVLLICIAAIFTFPFSIKAQQCISNVFMENSACDSLGIYTGFVTFAHSPNVDSVSLFYDSNFFGNHSVANLPIVLHPLVSDDFIHLVEVVDANVTTCRDSFQHFTNHQSTANCSAEIIGVSSFCIDDVLHITLNYSFVEPFSEPHITVNGEFISNGEVGLDLVQTFTVPSNPNAVYEISLADAELPECSDVTFLQVSDCQPNCLLGWELYEVACGPNNTYEVEFFIDDNVGAFNAYIDDELLLSAPDADSTVFYTITNLASDSLPLSHTLTVCSQNEPNCCATFDYTDPVCGNFTCDFPIEFRNASTTCVSDSTYLLNASITSASPSNSYLLIDVNQNEYGPFTGNPSNQGDFVFIEALVDSDIAGQFIIYDVANPACSATFEASKDCSDFANCGVEIHGTEYECNADELFIIINYDFVNPFTEGHVFINGDYFSNFDFGIDKFITIVIPNPIDNFNYVIEMRDAELPVCGDEVTITPNCSNQGECEIVFLQIGATECNDAVDGTYDFDVFFDIDNYNANLVDVFVNNTFYDAVPFTTQGVSITGVTPRANSDFDIVRICSQLDESCCMELEFMPPNCEVEECGYENVFLEYECTGNGDYFVHISFEAINTSNSLDLFIGQQFYTSFPNSQNLITAGPFPNGTGNVFQLRDEANPDCTYFGEFFWQECPVVDPCSVDFIEVLTIECRNDGTYDMDVLFETTNENNNFVDVFVNDQFIDFFQNDGNLSLLNITPRPGTNDDIITICVNDNPDCCETIEYSQPDCSDVLCYIEIVDIAYNCDIPGIYQGEIIIESQNTSGVLNLLINGSVEYTTQPNQTVIPFGALPDGIVYNFAIVDTQYDFCAAEGELYTNNCSEFCSVDFIEVVSSECNQDGSYDLNVSFGTTGANNDFIDVFVNDNFFSFVDNGLFTVENITPREGTDFGIITVCVSENPNCCTTIDFIQPDCEGNTACDIIDIEVDYVCDNDSLYGANIYFVSENTSGTVEVLVGNQSQGFFNVDAQPIQLSGFLNGSEHLLLIRDAQILGCTEEFELFFDDCSPNQNTCTITNLDVVEIECNEDNTFDMIAAYSIANANNSLIDVFLNGDFFESYFIGSSVVIENIPFSLTTDIKTLTICLNDNPDCCQTINYQQPDCGTECSIRDLEVVYECQSDSLYQAFITITAENTASPMVDVSVNGNSIGLFNINNQPFFVGTFLNGTAHSVVVNAIQNMGCSDGIDIFFEECIVDPEPCLVEFIEVDSIDCNPNGTYNLDVYWATANTNNDLVEISVNGETIDVFLNNGLTALFEITPRPNSDFDIIEICVPNSPDCCSVFEYLQPDCSDSNECAIEERSVEYECLGNGQYLAYISFIADNTSGIYGLEIDGEFYDTIQQTSAVIEVGPFENGSFHGYYLFDFEDRNCGVDGDIFTQECTGDSEPCAIEHIEVESLVCNSDGTYNIDVFWESANTNSDLVEISVNGITIDVFLNNGFTTLFEITPRSNSDFDIIEICVPNSPNCCNAIEYLQSVCEDIPDDCTLSDLEVEIDCDENTGLIFPALFFDYDPSSVDEVIVNVNGINIGFFDPNIQPIELDQFMSNSSADWTFTVTSATDSLCFVSTVIEDLECGGECLIGALDVSTECENDGTVFFIIDFFANNTSGQVGIVGNGNQYGNYNVDDLPITLGPFAADENDIWEFVVFDLNDDACSEVAELDDVLCDDLAELECVIEEFEVTNINCIGSNEYSMVLDFEVASNGPIPFTLFHNGQLMNSANTGALPLNLIGLIANDSTEIEVITICLDGLAGECCFDFTYETPACLFDAVDETLLEGVDLSPNPTRDVININHIPQEVIGLNIIDNLGRSMTRLNARENMQLDVSRYPEGIYMVQFYTQDNRVMSKRFIKMN